VNVTREIKDKLEFYVEVRRNALAPETCMNADPKTGCGGVGSWFVSKFVDFLKLCIRQVLLSKLELGRINELFRRNKIYVGTIN